MEILCTLDLMSNTMNKKSLQELTTRSTSQVIIWFESHPTEKFENIPGSKNWSTGQHLLHLIKLYKGINIALSTNKLLLRFKFGVRKKPELSYEQMKSDFETNYSNQKFESPDNVLPGPVSVLDRRKLITKLERESDLMNQQVEQLSEKSLSKYVLPHPYLGKLSLREFVMFNALHNQHHLNTLDAYYL